MTPTLRRLVREMLAESDTERQQMRARMFELQDEINELISLEGPIWDDIDAVEHPGTNRDDYERLGALHAELGLIARQIAAKVKERDEIGAALGIYRRGQRQ